MNRHRTAARSAPRRPARCAVAAVAVVAVATVAALTACSGRGSSGTIDSVDHVGVMRYPPAARVQAPSISGPNLAGEPVDVRAAGAGKVVVLNVWASWCAPCRSESPVLAAAANAFSANVVFIGIDEEDQASAAESFVASNHLPYQSLADSDGALLRKLTMLPQAGIPSTLFLDRSGRVAARVVGPLTTKSLTTVLQQLVSETT
jgi:thiol-disulfide isomerase/thioredoxin